MRATIEDICIRGSSNIAQKDIENNVGQYPVFGASGFIKNIDLYHQEKEYVAVVKDGAGIGRTFLLPSKTSVIGTLQYLIPNDKVTAKYLYYLVKSKHLERYYTGAAIPHIYFKDYKKESFELVNIKKQNEITAVLQNIENIIEIENKKLVLLDELVKARFVEMFGDIENNNYNFENGLVKDYCVMTQGVQIPMSEQIVEYKDGYNRYLYIQDLKYNKEEKLYVLDNYPDKILTTNDLVVVNTGNGSGEIYLGKDGILSNNLFKVSYDIFKFNPIFMYFYFSSDTFQQWLWSEMKEGTQPHLGHKIFGNKKLLVPPIEIQNEFASFVKQIDKSKFVVQKQLEETQQLFDSLMQKYFG